MSDILLSIVVPIYKVENYLIKCVDSLLTQDILLGEYEIILVDDGSPDRSPVICDEYSQKHKNVRVIHRPNGGLSAARNSGISVAKGKYIQFVDADDYLEPNVLAPLVKKMEMDELDVLRFNYQNVNERYEVFEPNKVSRPYVDYSDDVCDGLTFLTERLGFGCYACQFIIRKEILIDCLFKEGIYFEDTEWTPRMLHKARRVTSINLLVYNYLVRSGSITKAISRDKKRKVLESRYQLIDALQKQMLDVDDSRWFKGMIANIALAIVGDVSNVFYGSRKEFIPRLKSKSVFPLSIYHSTAVAKRKIRLANISPMFLCTLMHFKSR